MCKYIHHYGWGVGASYPSHADYGFDRERIEQMDATATR